MTEEKTRAESNVEVTQVVTQTQPAFKLPSGDVVGLEEFLVWLGNLNLEIKKAVLGK